MQVWAFYQYSRFKQRLMRGRIEERGAQLALEPMMLAERDRYGRSCFVCTPLETVYIGCPEL